MISAVMGNKVYNTAFRGDTAKNAQTAPKTSGEVKDGKKKLALALGGLATIGLAALLIAKGRKTPSEMSIGKFKKAGGFEKVNNDGVTHTLALYKKKPYTGTIKVANKNGDYQLKYTDGILNSSLCIKTPGEEKEVLASAFEKVYSYAENGKLTDVSIYSYYNAENCADKFSTTDLMNNRNIGKNLAKVENSSVRIKDEEITVRHLSPKLDSVTTKKTLLNKNGSLKGRIIAEKKLDKEKVADVIKTASEKQVNSSDVL